jgi:hypothetical protein
VRARAIALASTLLLLIAAPSTATGSGHADVAPCAPHIVDGRVPAWARAGFSGPVRMHYALGDRGAIAALLFAYPLESPAPNARANKILWVAHHPASARTNLRIYAQRMVGTRAVGVEAIRTVAGGPGPSIVDLPHAGCWRLTLDWGPQFDTLDLQYRAR